MLSNTKSKTALDLSSITILAFANLSAVQTAGHLRQSSRAWTKIQAIKLYDHGRSLTPDPTTTTASLWTERLVFPKTDHLLNMLMKKIALINSTKKCRTFHKPGLWRGVTIQQKEVANCRDLALRKAVLHSPKLRPIHKANNRFRAYLRTKARNVP